MSVVVKLPTGYFPDPNQGRPVALGTVFIGVVDTDPEILANRITVTLLQEDGTEVSIAPASQPLSLNAGGVFTHNGSVVQVNAAGNYSMTVLDASGVQEYHFPDSNAFPSAGVTLLFTSGAADSLAVTSTGAATGDLVETFHYDSALISGSGATFQATGVTTIGKAGNTPDPDGLFYDVDGIQFFDVGEVIFLQQFGATGTLATHQAAVTAATGRRLIIPEGTHVITLTVLADMIEVLANTTIEWAEGAVIQWDFYGMPLYISAEGAGDITYLNPNIRWNGTAVDPLPFTMQQVIEAIGQTWTAGWASNRSAPTTILAAGSDNARVINPNFASVTSGAKKAIHNHIVMGPKADGLSRATGNVISGGTISDYVIGVLVSGMDNFKLTDQTGINYNSYDSEFPAGHSAPGHMFYISEGLITNTNLIIDNILDEGIFKGPNADVQETAFKIRDTDLFTISNLVSKRPHGFLDMRLLSNGRFNNCEWSNITEVTPMLGPGQFVWHWTSGISDNVHFNDISMEVGDIDPMVINFALTDGSELVNSTFKNIRIKRAVDNLNSGEQLWSFRGTRCLIELVTDISSSSPTTRPSININTSSANNSVDLYPIGADRMKRVVYSASAGNSCRIFEQSVNSTLSFTDTQDDFTLNTSWTTQLEGVHASRTGNLGSGTTPSNTFTLPGVGSYYITAELYKTVLTDRRGAVFLVNFNTGAGAMNLVQQIGADWVLGAAVTGIACAVDAAGVVTISGTLSGAANTRITLACQKMLWYDE